MPGEQQLPSSLGDIARPLPLHRAGVRHFTFAARSFCVVDVNTHSCMVGRSMILLGRRFWATTRAVIFWRGSPFVGCKRSGAVEKELVGLFFFVFVANLPVYFRKAQSKRMQIDDEMVLICVCDCLFLLSIFDFFLQLVYMLQYFALSQCGFSGQIGNVR